MRNHFSLSIPGGQTLNRELLFLQPMWSLTRSSSTPKRMISPNSTRIQLIVTLKIS